MEAAAEAVVTGGLSIRKSASNNDANNKNMEDSVAEYVKKAGKIFHEITITDLRRPANRMAVANKVTNIPQSWTKDEMPGFDWAMGFLIRNNSISLRTPKATSIRRIMDNLENVLRRNLPYGPD